MKQILLKQLLLNFLFFVAAALILIQCAKLFPTKNNVPMNKSGAGIINYRNNPFNSVAGIAAAEPGFGTLVRSPLFRQQVFANDIMAYIHSYRPFYNPYLQTIYHKSSPPYKHKPKPKNK